MTCTVSVSPRPTAADAVQGHAFTLGFGAGNLSTNTGGRGSQLPALAAQRTPIDIIATQLAFIVPPQGVFSGSPLAIQPSIAGVDAEGRIDTEFTDTLTVSVSGSGILLQAIAVAVEGVASFTNLTYITTIDDEKITFSVDDQAGGLEGDLAASQSSLLNANAINDPPHIDLFSLILKEDELFFINIKDAISDPDDSLVVDILNPAPIIDLPGLFLDAGTPARLLLDDFARDDEPVERLHWTAQLVPGLEIEIDNTLRQIIILAPNEGQQPTSLVLTVRDLQGDTALDTMLVTVHPSIAETDTSVTDTVTIDLPDSTLNDTVVVDLPDSTLNDTVVVDLPDSTLNDTVVVDLPDSTLNDTVVVDLPDSTLNDTVVVDLPDSTLNDTIVVDLPDSTLNDTVVVDLPDSISTDTTFTRPDTLPARINQTPRLLSVPNLKFSSGASIRLVLDRYVFDDAPLNALTWSAAADSSLQVEIDPLRRIATVQATGGFIGQSRIRFTVFDSEGAGISFFANVGVIPPPEPLGPADFSADGRLTVDDFFFFADHFGLNSLHPSWDPRFDLDNDGQITLQDFLEFADLYQQNQDTLSRSR
jgi:hypothetical protein